MSAECYPIGVLPHISRLYADYLGMGEAAKDAPIRRWFGGEPSSGAWMRGAANASNAHSLADALKRQSIDFGAGEQALAHIEKLRCGARAVVTGQQVGLLGGPLLTLLKAATAVARAREATAATGIDHVPVFWLASEDHDFEEVDQVSFPAKVALETLHLKSAGGQGVSDSHPGTVGGIALGAGAQALLQRASDLLGYAPVCQLLQESYGQEGATFAGAFGRLMARLFSAHGLVVMDAAGAEFHRLGEPVLRAAIEWAEELEGALLARTGELEDAGYHAQVLVKPGSSLLFLLEPKPDGIGCERRILRRVAGGWKAGSRSYTTDDLLGILETEPQRLSPNALLRPVFQDAVLPTAAYIGGPAEIAYFAQSAVLYERIARRVTPVLPRLSATLVTPAIAAVMDRHEVSMRDIFEAKTSETLSQRLGARAMPLEGKRRIAAAGNAMDAELSALTSYLGAVDQSLGRSATVSANKMRYQMNRLRRIAATFEVQKEGSLRKHADAMISHLFPGGHPQERVVGGAWFLAQAGPDLVDRLVDEAGQMCLGHSVVRL